MGDRQDAEKGESRMTREEAISYLNTLYMALAVFPNQNISLGNVEELKESVDMAIKALEQNESAKEWYKLFVEKLEQQTKTGHWTTVEMTQDDGCRYTVTYCSECDEDVDYRTDYCPNCGARMVEPQESEEQDADSD